MSDLEEGIEAVARCKVKFDSTDVVELSLEPGDHVLITRLDVGDGWLEGVKEGGDTIGLFPEAYVEIIERRNPPSLSKAPGLSNTNPFAQSDSRPASPLEDEDSVMAQAALIFNTAAAGGGGDGHSVVAQERSRSGSSSSADFSSGPMIMANSSWKRLSEPYKIDVITGEDRGTKFRGIKQFTVFKVTDTRTKVTVERRFKHFTWLHEQLVRTYPYFVIPPLPEKQVAGRFEEEFVERRRRRLQRFLDQISQHPVLGASAVFLHFLTATDHKAWKAGKRLSEQLPTITESIVTQTAAASFDAPAILSQTSAFMDWFGRRLTGWHEAGAELTASFHALAEAFDKMAKTLMLFAGPTAGQPAYDEWWDGGRSSGEFASVLFSLARFGSGVERIGSMMREHQEQQSITLLEFLKHYSELTMQLTKCLPSAKTTDRPASANSRSKTRSHSIGDLDSLDESATKIMLAEVRYFHERLIQDFHALIHDFIREQIEFHRKAADTWESLVLDFEKADGDDMP